MQLYWIPDIDQRFSKVSSSLKRHDAKTIPQLVDAVSCCTREGMDVEVLGSVYNVRDWLAPCLSEIHNHSFPHVYR